MRGLFIQLFLLVLVLLAVHFLAVAVAVAKLYGAELAEHRAIPIVKNGWYYPTIIVLLILRAELLPILMNSAPKSLRAKRLEGLSKTARCEDSEPKKHPKTALSEQGDTMSIALVGAASDLQPFIATLSHIGAAELVRPWSWNGCRNWKRN